MTAYDAEFLVMTHADNVRDSEKAARTHTLEILWNVRDAGSAAALEMCADLADGFMNPPRILADLFL